ncbi:Aldolase-type TIM barrel [Penicillium camemberti]|uniref:Aldolase-type TIM barrel n=1 Tax=Penicillium camemberti (strain FM 013) TaxID=1429867 RepID=A0A0G4NX65_PENC3|nr:Aldolase-type TIM barrel [Penicillium camemberti]
MASLHGILVALITPFTDDKTAIDESRLQAHIEHLIKAGVHGLVPGGSTGEFTTLTVAERKQLTELCVKFAAGRVPVVAGTGSLSSAEAVELSVHAAQVGAASDNGRAPIHTASGLPIVFYNIPAASGITLSPTEIAGLSKVGVKYLKDTSGNAPALTELIFGLSDQITSFNGWDTLTFYGLAAGAPGGVWGAANIIPELAVELYEAVSVKGDLKLGREIWAKAWPICKFLEAHSYAAAVKTGVELIGQPTGGLRKPFALLNPELTAELKQLLQKAGVKTV